jgi:SAM-dependent methyltransferase
MDFSQTSISYARNISRKKNLPIHYYLQSYLTLDLAQQFDVITLIYYDFAVLSAKNRAELLKRIYRALTPGGILIFDVLTKNHYSGNIEEYKRWEYAEKSFFCPKPHLRLESFYIYDEQNTFCTQHILITEYDVKYINIWEHVFTKDELECDLRDAGFSSYTFYGNACGENYDENGKEICVAAYK